ncbi:MAG: PAS domain S-box protein, partial [Actinomycetota bacterium]|nr:PAS domain S-box protein [Actinomycetota bacterium]
MSGLSEQRRGGAGPDDLLARAKAAEERYTNLFDRLADAVLVTDAQGHYVDANMAATKLLGYSRAELMKLSVAEVVVAGPGQAEAEFTRFLAEGYWR